MGKVGRPASGGNKKHRKVAREWYRKQSTAKKKQIVQTRDKEAQRRADRKRSGEARNQYHKKTNATQSKIASGTLQRPATCSRCGARTKTQYDHTTGKWLCAKCNNPANNKG